MSSEISPDKEVTNSGTENVPADEKVESKQQNTPSVVVELLKAFRSYDEALSKLGNSVIYVRSKGYPASPWLTLSLSEEAADAAIQQPPNTTVIHFPDSVESRSDVPDKAEVHDILVEFDETNIRIERHQAVSQQLGEDTRAALASLEKVVSEL